MEIFYLKKQEILNHIDKKSLESFWDGRDFLCEDRYFEHVLGLFLTKFVAKHIYGVKNLNIELRGKKPYFMTGGINFSISHSNDIVLVAFNNAEIGADVEFMCQRNYRGIMKRYGENNENPSRLDFYKFWTLHEAEIKLHKEVRSLFSTLLEDDYVVSCVSSNILVINFCIKQIIIENKGVKNLNLLEEFEHPKNIKLITTG